MMRFLLVSGLWAAMSGTLAVPVGAALGLPSEHAFLATFAGLAVIGLVIKAAFGLGKAVFTVALAVALALAVAWAVGLVDVSGGTNSRTSQRDSAAF